MLHLIPRSEFHLFPRLLSDMFNDRATVFIDNFGWTDLQRNPYMGWERDQFDAIALDTVYAVIEGEEACTVTNLEGEEHTLQMPRHRASARMLLMNGSNMIDDVFHHLVEGMSFDRNHTLEISRFCPSPRLSKTDQYMSAGVLLYTGMAMARTNPNIHGFTGLQTAAVLAIYRRLGMDVNINVKGKELGVSYWHKDSFDKMANNIKLKHLDRLRSKFEKANPQEAKDRLDEKARIANEKIFAQVDRAAERFAAQYPHFKPGN